LFGHVIDLHRASIEDAKDDEKGYISRRNASLTISYKDGTRYEVHDIETMRKVVPGKGRDINSVSLESRYGNLSCSIELTTWRSFDPIEVRVSGPEDKASHFAEVVISDLTQNNDITVFARRIWPIGWAFVLSVAVFTPLTIGAIKELKDLAILVVLAPVVLILSIPFEILRTKWLPPVAFLWGADGRRANQAKRAVTAILVTLPLWLLGTAVTSLYI
jgi:hypothetical protein